MDLVKFVEALEFLEKSGVLLVDKERPVSLANQGEVMILNKIEKSYICKRYQENLEDKSDGAEQQQ